MSTCKYSLILATFNMKGKIENCLESILCQKVQEFEVIVINDGSTDDTKKIVEEYSVRDKRIKLYNYENKGVSAARNRGIEQANGKYIIFIDPDDRIKPDLLEMLEPYTNQEIDLIRFGAEMVGVDRDNTRTNVIFNVKEITEEVFNGHKAIERWQVSRRKYAAPWLYCAKKDLYTKNNVKFPEEIRSHDDFATMPILISNADTVKEIDYIGYEYIQHSDSIGHTQSNEGIKRNTYDFIYAYDMVLKHLKKILADDPDVDFENISKNLFERLEIKVFNLSPDIRNKFIKELIKRKTEIVDTLDTKNSLDYSSQFKKRKVSDNTWVESLSGEEFETEWWQIKKVGDYCFNIDGKSKRVGMQRVRKIRSIRKMYYNDYLIFSNIDYSKLSEDSKYRETVLDVLLSDTNLLLATGCNNGYTGDIIIDLESEEPRICFDNDIIYFARELPVITKKIEDKGNLGDEER